MSIESRTLAEQFTAVVYGSTDRDGLAAWLPDALAAASAYLQKWGAGPVGRPYVRFVDGEVEAGYPASTPVGGEGEVEPSDLPAGSAAVAVTTVDDVEGALDRLRAWVDQRGATVAGGPWEILLDDDPVGRREVVLPYRS